MAQFDASNHLADAGNMASQSTSSTQTSHSGGASADTVSTTTQTTSHVQHSVATGTVHTDTTESGTDPFTRAVRDAGVMVGAVEGLGLAVSGGSPEVASVVDSTSNKPTHGKQQSLSLPAVPLAQYDEDIDSPNASSIFPNPHAGKPDNTPTAAANFQLPDYVRLILTAQVYDVAMESPLQKAHNLSTRIGNTVLLKREDLQPVFSFKLRGAYNRMHQLSEEEKQKGVIACSAGNHAQGVALAAQKMGIQATIVMPTVTPPIKWRNVQRLGAQVVLHGNDFDEAKAECARLAKERGYINIPPYDDPYVIAGQGTVGLEIMRQSGPKIDAIFICIGGGGLAAGVASYVKRIFPHVKIIGVETHDAAAMTRSLKAGERVMLSQVGLFADGAAVKVVGEETFRVCKELVDETVLVSTDEICAGIKDVFEDTRSVVEPAGALGLAGVKKYVQEKGCKGMTFVAVTSGANMNFDRLRFVAERAELGENREALITVIIPERPGSFMDLYKAISPRAVSEFSYRYGDPSEAHIFMSFVVNDREKELGEIFKELDSKGMRAMDASRNEMAKAHARYLVGGRKEVANERLFRFSFPERPGALSHFLSTLRHPLWNVSLFHYRNYGGDVSRVLAGVQVPPETTHEFEKFLKDLRYPYVEETDNLVYQQFLR
ncbi:threonine ammonia-lyase, biosynthetic [Spizellomyces punctatus DAOM BR117]|uniref:Threonine dehydratase n=1 Tax=Spizellomyces punctatus (strain DAOM BR117) TaxID=645134 RepID=A0A0L0HCZ8_SPIPD|nr:threonine ammonia-lyase, biosynthetic [Spizellomyces punctatus DAOM BR117]KNC99017.1 threonine ammonia-lyase, biosynthetic [Spizellomyces punctatus DAOM BR117]|eukprot:XP_016607057.1 threonine ammonia-lyase, biosynthetic [Spizellomyces punctatus DAOM BR117]